MSLHVWALWRWALIAPRSATLRMSDLAPRPPTPKQSFKIMQRVPVGSAGSASSRAGSVVGDENEAGGSKRKTLEQREADYALARERIYGNDGNATASAAPSEVGDADTARPRNARQRDAEDSDDDFVPRQPYGHIQPVYPSLYHPKGTSSEPTQEPNDQVYGYQPGSQYSYANQPVQMPAYGGGPMGNGYGGQQQVFPPRQGGYMDGSAPPFVPQNVFGAPPWPPQGMPNGPMPQMGAPGAWSYGPAPGHPSMPIIPQGVQSYPQQAYAYPPQYANPPPQHAHQQRPFNGNLVQPTPLRPGPLPHPHSSNSSSISSRSYQDYSRPHSRGSTTSTRSAASSVRIGVMYPAGNNAMPHGYRQRGMKGQPYNNHSGSSSNNNNNNPPNTASGEKRSTRGHSPVSFAQQSIDSSDFAVFRNIGFISLFTKSQLNLAAASVARSASTSYQT